MKYIATKKADILAHEVYTLTKSFPKNEIFGVTSQIRRAAISVVLNLIEGFTRKSSKEYYHFLEISYGSLKEVKYLLYFCLQEKYIIEKEYKDIIEKAEEVGKLV